MIEDDNYTKLTDVIQMPDYTKNPFIPVDYGVHGIKDGDLLPNYNGGDGYA